MTGRELELCEAVGVFATMPAELQLASLHPQMVTIDAKRDALLRSVFWCFRVASQCLLHGFHLGDNPGLGIRDIQSAYGYGGPLSNSDDPRFLKQADRSFAQWARDTSVTAEFLRFHPLVPHAKWYSGETVRNRTTVHIDLTRELFEQYKTRRRTEVRRFLERGSTVERVAPERMRSVFPRLYRENMDRVGAAREYYFPESYFDALFRFAGCHSWLVYTGAQAVAGAVILVSDRAKVAEYFLGAKGEDASARGATTGLLHAAAIYYGSIGYRVFYLGGGRSVAADDSLLFFKQGFSSLTGEFRTASKVYDPRQYGDLKRQFPAKAASGRVLFYKD